MNAAGAALLRRIADVVERPEAAHVTGASVVVTPFEIKVAFTGTRAGRSVTVPATISIFDELAAEWSGRPRHDDHILAAMVDSLRHALD